MDLNTYNLNLENTSLLDCYEAYSDHNNHRLRIVLEIIHYLMEVKSVGHFLKAKDDIIDHLSDRVPGLMSIGFNADLMVEVDKYVDNIKKISEVEEI